MSVLQAPGDRALPPGDFLSAGEKLGASPPHGWMVASARRDLLNSPGRGGSPGLPPRVGPQRTGIHRLGGRRGKGLEAWGEVLEAG